MNFFNKSVSAARMIDEGVKDRLEEARLETEAEYKERQARKLIAQGFYPHTPKKRMPLPVHRDQLEAIEATSDEWKVFQERNDLASGFDPQTGMRLTHAQYSEAIRQLDLTPEDLREIHYWRGVETDMRIESMEEQNEISWQAMAR